MPLQDNRRNTSITNIYIPDLRTYLKDEKQRFMKSFATPLKQKSRLEDYDFIALIGSGSFGKVVLAQYHNNKGEIFAIKIIDKQNIVRLRQIPNILNEKRLLETGRFPFLLHMESYFIDNSNIYFVLPFMAGGDLFEVIKSHGRLPEYTSKFYAAQICLALEYLHYMDIVHRDLKPENVLIDSYGYLKLSDFGFCKLVVGRTASVCGTPDYLAPEILMSQGYGKAVDWWSFGVFIYELNYGLPPFYDKDELRRYKKISRGKYHIPSSFSPNLIDLVTHLLERDLSKRYGNLVQGADDIKYHPWFKELHWMAILNRSVEPPMKPNSKFGDLKRHQAFSKHNLHIAPVDSYKTEFQDF